MRSHGKDKKSVSFACVVNNKTVKTESVQRNYLNYSVVSYVTSVYTQAMT